MKTAYYQLNDEEKRLYHERIECKKAKLFHAADSIRVQLEHLGVDVLAVDQQRKGPVRHFDCPTCQDTRRELVFLDEELPETTGPCQMCQKWCKQCNKWVLKRDHPH